ncbi:MAG UNVERIFIED_CONTAM: Asp-tRNA(Asn)/Glu-tRNA(Gln) amidotransferase subunit GatA [Anaerolineae bacterium]|jgi:aspartyl-tRNA(Asn)/glutamyl-tRNA(Gln) amidotransferase subunit A
MTHLTELSLSEGLAKLNAGELSAVDWTQAYLDRITQTDPAIHAYLTVTDTLALEQARQADEARARGEQLPLLGVPIAIKDAISTKGIETTCGSKILAGYRPVFNATAVERLLQAGAIMLGKVNLDEFAMGSTTENSAYGVTRNPWNLEHVPGGSSGGSGAAVAGGLAAASLGTDTGGSVRLPGSFCGISALKPSYGRVSRFGLIAYGSSLDQIGSLGWTVEDVTRVMQVMAGHDPKDSTSMRLDVPDYLAQLGDSIRGMKLGIPKEYFIEDAIQPEVLRAIRAGIAQLEQLGAEIVEISLPHTEYCLSAYYIIAMSEASSNLARYDGIRFGAKINKDDMWDSYRATRGQGFGEEVKRRILIGTYTLSAGYYDAYYGKAQAVRTLVKQDFDRAFESVDAIVTPVAPTTANRFGSASSDPMQMYLMDVFSVSANLAGIPGMSIPCGFDDAGLPIGMQLLGAQFKEETLIKLGHAYQQVTDWHTHRPKPIHA